MQILISIIYKELISIIVNELIFRSYILQKVWLFVIFAIYAASLNIFAIVCWLDNNTLSHIKMETANERSDLIKFFLQVDWSATAS